jgi:prepilin-type processing-associated H-X9-DG protein
VQPTSNNAGLDNGNGIFFRSDYTRPLRITDIKDGTSSTFMIGEDIPAMNVHCDWPFFNHATGTCAIPLNSGMQPGQPGYNTPKDWQDLYSFRSNHSQGANFAFADGSVQFISQNIDLTLYRNLASYAGGETAARP